MSSASLRLYINGEPDTVAEGCTLAELVERSGVGGRRVAVERNGEIVPRSRLGEVHVADGDRIEIVHAIGGG